MNDVKFKMDISDSLSDHLNNFPKDFQFTHLISRLDKNVLFAYQTKNGFGNADLQASMDDQQIIKISNSFFKHPKKVLLDTYDFNISSKYIDMLANSLFSSLKDAIYLNIKNQLRMQKMATLIQEKCTPISIKLGWILNQCGMIEGVR